MADDKRLAYSEDVAGSLRQVIPHVLDEHWSSHQHHFEQKPDAVLNIYHMLTARLPGGIGEQLMAALRQWMHTVGAQYDATHALTRGYGEGVEALSEVDRQLGRTSSDNKPN